MDIATGESDLAGHMVTPRPRVQRPPRRSWPQIIDMQVKGRHGPPLARARYHRSARRRIDKRNDRPGRYQTRVCIHQKSRGEGTGQFRPVGTLVYRVDAQESMMPPRRQAFQTLKGIVLVHRSGVPTRFTGKAQSALGDQVALNLISASVDRVGARKEEQVG